MASPARGKFRWAIVVPTGCKRMGAVRHTCKKIRIPARMFPCSIKEKLTLVEVSGVKVEIYETEVTDKDGHIVRFPGSCPKFLEDGVMPRHDDPYDFVNRMEEEERNRRDSYASGPLP